MPLLSARTRKKGVPAHVPQGCFAPDNLQSALIASFSVPETCKRLYTFSLIVPDSHIYFVQIFFGGLFGSPKD